MAVWNAAVIIGALGYFVDVFDLFLFSVVRVKSLSSLGVPPEATLETGILLLNIQMLGLILGGLGWGLLGDRRGRKTVLFGSILLYSVANLLNATVSTVEAYAVYRFLAGLGLAGELGAAITLVSESLPAEKRGTGTTLVASFGLLGAMAAAIVGENLPWRHAYVVGGVLGLALLILRFRLEESSLFRAVEQNAIPRGDLRILFRSRSTAKKYLWCILVGIPVYFVVGILITFAPEFAKELGVVGTVVTGKAVLYSYLGAAVGDFLGGMASQWMKNRKKVIAVCLWLNFFMIAAFLLNHQSSTSVFYFLCGLLGATTGYWAVLITLSAEQFGTNIRSTVTTSVPNFVRGSVIPLSLSFGLMKGHIGLLQSAGIIGLAVTIVAYFSIRRLDETYGKDIGFIEP